MRFFFGLICLLFTTSALAEEETGNDSVQSPAETTATDTPQAPHPELTARVDAAIRAYLEGNHDRAVAELMAVNAEPKLTDPVVRQRARLFLAEVLFVRGAREAAWDAFRTLLDETPDLQLDPFEHPPDVVAFFETVKTSGPSAAPAPAPATRAPFPRAGFLPLGVYQFQQGQRSRGVLLAASQIATGTGSVALWWQLRNNPTAPTEAELPIWELRRNMNLGLTAAFYGLWGLGIATAAADWETKQSGAVQLILTPTGAIAALHF